MRMSVGQRGCRQPPDILAAYIDDEIDPIRREALARHVEACPRCGADVANQLQVNALLAPDPYRIPAVPPGLVKRLWEWVT